MNTFDPAPAETALLWLIREHESNQDYTARNRISSAEGAYQFLTGTWAWVSSQTGVDLHAYPTAAVAPARIQDINALWLLRKYGPNRSISWQASGPYPTEAEVNGMLVAVGAIA